MPVITIPKAERKVAPGEVGSRRMRMPTSNIPAAINNIGVILEAREKQLRNQRDTSIVLEKLSAIRTQALDKVSELTSTRTGKNADGVLKDYQTWHEKAFGELFQELENPQQQQVFRSHAETYKMSDMEKLARHQSVENNRFVVSTLESTVANGRDEVASNPDDLMVIENVIENDRIALTNAFPGLDVGGKLDAEREQLQLISLKSLVQTNPVEAKQRLEAWKGSLGEYYPEAKKVVDKEFLYQEATTKYPNNFDAQLKLVDDAKGLDEGVRISIRERIHAERAEARYNENYAKSKMLESVQNAVGDLAINGKYSEALDTVDKSGLEPWDKLKMHNGLVSSMQTVKSSPDAQLNTSLHYDEIPEADIWNNPELAFEDKKYFTTLKRSATEKERAPLVRMMKDAKKGIASAIIGGNLLMPAPQANILASIDALNLFERYMMNAKDDGERMAMLDQTSPKYIVSKIVKASTLGLKERISAQADAYRMEETPPDYKPLPGESIDAYQKRLISLESKGAK